MIKFMNSVYTNEEFIGGIAVHLILIILLIVVIYGGIKFYKEYKQHREVEKRIVKENERGFIK